MKKMMCGGWIWGGLMYYLILGGSGKEWEGGFKEKYVDSEFRLFGFNFDKKILLFGSLDFRFVIF